VYVNNIIIAIADMAYTLALKNEFCTKFEMHNLAECKRCLNIRITRTDKSIRMDQSEYVKTSILKEFAEWMGSGSSTKDAPLPPDASERLAEGMTEELTAEERAWVASFPFRTIIGALLCLTIHTRPDMSYAVDPLSRYSLKPTKMQVSSVPIEISAWHFLERH
jgi:hypothetical protein